jgi:hypothetical protein
MTIRPDDKNALQELRTADPNTEIPHLFLNYSYFQTEQNARKSAEKLIQNGFEVEVRRGADGTSWLAFARQVDIPSEEYIERMRFLFENIASELNGEYDGWEAERFPA